MKLRTPFLAIVASSILACTASAQAPAEKPVVSGKFLGDGTEGRIQHVLTQTMDPFSGQPAIRLVFTEKSPAASKKPEFDAGFKKLGNALIISMKKDGGVFGCEIVHSSHKKSPFSSIGRVKVNDLKITDTQISGQLTSGGEQEFLGQKWEVDLAFTAPLPKGAFAAVEPEPAPKKPDTAPAPVPAGPALPVAKIPLPAGALDLEYKALVGQIHFRTDSPVAAASTDISTRLKTAGWKDAPGSLNGRTNAILRRTLGDAELTIMIQPSGKGSTVRIMTRGLDWSTVPAGAPAKPAAAPASGDLESEAARRVQDALRSIPGI